MSFILKKKFINYILKFLTYSILAIVFIFISLFLCGTIYQASEPDLIKTQRIADTVRIKNDLIFLTNDCRFRNYQNMNSLNKAADYIKDRFLEISTNVEEQKYAYENLEFRNIICSLGPENGERIIVGAHYDVCDDQDGADDNASGIAGLLELARLLKDLQLKYRIELVAYSTEEPPFFKTDNMGSYVHAKSLFDKKVSVKGMICLEMIGYFSEKENSQTYPVFFLEWFYGNKGNYITIVQKYWNGTFGNFISETMKKDQVIPTKSFSGPSWLPGVDFSDHLNYWKFGYNAVMITNSAFYRNFNYHTSQDKLEYLNIGNIGLVVDELYRSIKKIE